MTSFLEEYYTDIIAEEQRFCSQSGKVEFLTTLKYIEDYLKPNAKILEIGAGTGQYSLYLSRKGYDVTAVELVQKNIDVLKSKLTAEDNLRIEQGNALKLDFLLDETYDLILLLGPMYHLYSQTDRIQALEQAKKRLKPQGIMMVAYIMNESTIVQWALKGDGSNFKDILAKGMLTEDFHCLSQEKDIFQMIRIEEINALNDSCHLQREKLVATDLFTHYIESTVDNYDSETFNHYLNYHYAICERQELVGASNHVLDIVRFKT
ncbi:class I SAM-dependent methyltransferase [Facklamia miroungae]|uniref:Methyltransferase domain-containing protein n=1 Tax=Facklamia miroungae TaxID=120956 RepID=A0A1G7PVE8_9LACT|nr:class I SAM-dependent methyltransferase [Facklamia miroungae]NKZ28843.1 class I SAM-dependent methyltransferase [Facklamia miroungae]SDF90185.1 Methyltransferase domain-containing protein [Facklamia miroungae]